MSLHDRMAQSHGTNGEGAPKDMVSFRLTLKGKKQIAEGTFEFAFEKPTDFYAYQAGQHGRVSLINPAETDDEGDTRFLSFASTPDDQDLRFAMRMSQSAFKRQLGAMLPGQQVLFQMRQKSMHGSFALQEATDAARPAVFLIGGIGIVPVYSMIRYALAHSAQHKITLIYSNRRPEDAPYLAELQELAKQHPDVFELVATMTQPENSATTWSGETGFITKEMVQKYVPDVQAPIFYVAGLTEMVVAMQKMLSKVGVPKDNIRAEEFGSFNMAHADEKQPSRKSNAKYLLVSIVLLVALIAGYFWMTKG